MATPRERFMTALDGGQVEGRVPHFELVFFLTMEAFGKVHPSHRNYGQWDQMEEKERQLHREDQADIFIRTAERFEHDAIFLHVNPGRDEEFMRVMDIIRERTGDRYFLMMHGDATYGMPHGENMVEFSVQMAEQADELKEKAQKRVDEALERAEEFAEHGALDGYALCADYCFNSGPFFSPDQFAEFVAPYLKQLCDGYRELGLYSIKHTDGNIMPILEQLVDTGPDALHSLDPQGGVDIAEVKRLYGDRVCLIGNVNCGKLDTGTDDEVVESARYALRNGMPGGGYIFSSSNCVYTGMRLKRYELMLDVWLEEGSYGS
jgi:uroporphyrinogen decarboxylase